MLKIAYDAQLQKQRPPAAVCPACSDASRENTHFQGSF